MSTRFAIFYAPDSQSEFWHLASRWLGRDAVSEGSLNHGHSQNLPLDLHQHTQSPARYGFHATLKPPMRLGPNVRENEVFEYAERFAAQQCSNTIGKLCIKNLDGFLALVPQNQSAQIGNVAGETVKFFEPLRAELNEEERRKRLAASLSPKQQEYLDKYGYPYIFDEFHLHLTLTNRLEPKIGDRLLGAASNHFAPILQSKHWLDCISIYREDSPGQPFARIADYPLKSSLKENK